MRKLILLLSILFLCNNLQAQRIIGSNYFYNSATNNENLRQIIDLALYLPFLNYDSTKVLSVAADGSTILVPVIGSMIKDSTITNSKIISLAYSKITGTPTSFPPTGVAGGDLTGNYPAPTLTTSGVTAGTYGSATQVAVATVDAKGRITTVTNTTITGTVPGGSAGGSLSGSYPNPSIANNAVTHPTIAIGAVDSSNLGLSNQTGILGGLAMNGLDFTIAPYIAIKAGIDTITKTNIQINDGNYHTIKLLPVRDGDIRFVTRTGNTGIVTIIGLKGDYTSSTINDSAQVLLMANSSFIIMYVAATNKWITPPGLLLGTSAQVVRGDGSLASGVSSSWACTGLGTVTNMYTGNHTWSHDVEYGMIFDCTLHSDTCRIAAFNNYGCFVKKGRGSFPLVILPITTPGGSTTYIDSTTSPIIINNNAEVRQFAMATNNGFNFTTVSRYFGVNRGQATLVAGTVTVSYPNIDANATLQLQTVNTSGIAGNISYTITPGSGFVINSSSNTDARLINYQVFD